MSLGDSGFDFRVQGLTFGFCIMNKKLFLVLVLLFGFVFGSQGLLVFAQTAQQESGKSGLCGRCQKDDDCQIDKCAQVDTNGDGELDFWPCYCANGVCKAKSGVTVCSQLGSGGPSETLTTIVDRITSWLLKAAFVVAPTMFVIAGLLFYGAGGDSSKVKLAKKIALWSFVGLMLILFSRAFESLLNYILGW